MARVEFGQILDNLVYTLGLWISRSEFGTTYRTLMRPVCIPFTLLPFLGNSKEVFNFHVNFTRGSREFVSA